MQRIDRWKNWGVRTGLAAGIGSEPIGPTGLLGPEPLIAAGSFVAGDMIRGHYVRERAALLAVAKYRGIGF
ncbi:hypothetical protein M1563_01570 [Patescibacteria group bacterium]|nr:hypothetical protein [Patescibacteria group bacterium]MCL5409974.1 hypothetical protein [Patescibacteria group bacterium]